MELTEPYGQFYLELEEFSRASEQFIFEVELIEQLVDPAPGSKVLDLGCGVGGHALEFGKRGYCVTGLDFSQVILDTAVSNQGDVRPNMTWICQDMRDLQFEGEFDLVINLYNSFGFFEDEMGDIETLLRTRKAMKPGARFLQQVPNVSALVRGFQHKRQTLLPNGVLVTELRDFDIAISKFRSLNLRKDQAGSIQVAEYTFRLYCATELAAMHRLAGMEVERIIGGLDGLPLGLDSNYLVIVSRAI